MIAEVTFKNVTGHSETITRTMYTNNRTDIRDNAKKLVAILHSFALSTVFSLHQKDYKKCKFSYKKQ